MKIGYLGPRGTYTDRALECWMPGVQKKPFAHLEDVFAATASKDVDLGFVPLENVIEGPVTQTFDCLLKYAGQLQIVDSTVLAIEHALGALAQRSAITRIFSKDTALAQCSEYLLTHFPQAETIPTQSTAKAMEIISSQQLTGAAAIGMESAFAQYGLEVIATNVGNKRFNKTRFAALGYLTPPASGNDLTTIVVYPHRDRVGLLEDVLNIISGKYQINMCSIHSRPDGNGLFRFYLDLEGHISQEKVQGCIADIKARFSDTEVVFLGSYHYTPFNAKHISRIGIVGGKGKMGGWLARFFESVGYTVCTCGRDSEDSEKSLDECVRETDVVLVNVPIEATVEVVKRIGPALCKGQLLVDNTGVKSSVVPAMLAATSPEVEVLSVHLMFGSGVSPTSAGLTGENVISIHTERSGKLADELESIFYKYGANITRATVEEHDRYMAIVQNLEHACSVAHAATLLSIVPQVQKLVPFATPNLRQTLLTMGRIHAGDPRLYGTMLKENPRALDTLQYYQLVLEQIITRLKKGDSCMFERIMSSNKLKLGQAFIENQCTASNAIQDALKKK